MSDVSADSRVVRVHRDARACVNILDQERRVALPRAGQAVPRANTALGNAMSKEESLAKKAKHKSRLARGVRKKGRRVESRHTSGVRLYYVITRHEAGIHAVRTLGRKSWVHSCTLILKTSIPYPPSPLPSLTPLATSKAGA